jgi:PQ loop repeat.
VLILTNGSVKQDKHEYSRIIKVGKIVAVHGILAVAQIIVGFASKQSTLYVIANTNGLLSALLTVIKYVPQIHTTYMLKHPGTLSIGMMCIQTPGGFVFTATLFFAKGSHWSSWVSYLVAALLQGTLLTLCIYYEYFRNHGLNAEIAERAAVDRIITENIHQEVEEESEPLLEP